MASVFPSVRNVSARLRLPAVVSRIRTPFVTGSSGGAYGYGSAISPENLNRSSPGGGVIRVTVTRGLVAYTGMMLLQGSQASALPSPSASCCPGLETFGQLSALSQRPSPSLSMIPVSAGHAALVPSHVSAGSQLPVDARQTNPLGRIASAGQLTLEPSQFSAMSHPPAAGRHTALADVRASAGQLSEAPSQLSARSHAPADARQTAVLLASLGQEALVPLQLSATSHTPAAAPHTVAADWNSSAGQFVVGASQFS